MKTRWPTMITYNDTSTCFEVIISIFGITTIVHMNIHWKPYYLPIQVNLTFFLSFLFFSLLLFVSCHFVPWTAIIWSDYERSWFEFTGPFRGYMRYCYHKMCDDTRFLTVDNVHFVKKVKWTISLNAINVRIMFDQTILNLL